MIQRILRKNKRKDELASCERKAQSELSPFLLADVVQLSVQTAVDGVKALYGLVKASASIGEGKAGVAVEEPDPKFVLQIADMRAQSLL